MDVLLDSNILIYSAAPNAPDLQVWLSRRNLFVSQITRLEVLGYYNLSENEESFFIGFINRCKTLELSVTIIDKAIELRQEKSMSLGDAIIAASAIVENLPLITANTKDFKHLPTLELIDPFQIN